MADLSELLARLTSTKSAERCAAAKVIGLNEVAELKEPLLQAYLKEASQPKTWQVQKEMIRALGKLGCQ